GEILDDDRLTAIGMFFETAAGLENALTRHLDSYGLPRVWLEVLLRVGRSPNGQLRMADLAAQVALSPSGLTRAGAKVEAEGRARARGAGAAASVRPEGPGGDRRGPAPSACAGPGSQRRPPQDLAGVADDDGHHRHLGLDGDVEGALLERAQRRRGRPGALGG